MARYPNPIIIGEAKGASGDTVDEQAVLAEDLAQPGIMRMQEWYICIGRWVIACSGKPPGSARVSSKGAYQSGSGSK